MRLPDPFPKTRHVRLSTGLGVVLAGVVVLDACCATEPRARGAERLEQERRVQKTNFVPAFSRFLEDASDADRLTQLGWVLAGELSCTACHHLPTHSKPTAADQALASPKRGPRLDGIGERVTAGWLRRFLNDPQTVKPGTTMPAMLEHLDDEHRKDALKTLVLFLSGSRDPDQFMLELPKTQVYRHEFEQKGDPRRGEVLFHRIGCVACHEPDPGYAVEDAALSDQEQLLKSLGVSAEEAGVRLPESVRSVPLGPVNEKSTRKSLTHFLFNPLRFRPAGRMPDLKLDPQEAADLAAYLLPASSSGAAEPARLTAADELAAARQSHPELVARGRELFVSLNCAACHQLEDLRAAPDVPAWDALAATARQETARPNCLTISADAATPPRRPLPRYRLNSTQRSGLQAALQLTAPPAQTANERVELVMQRWNCFACHERQGQGGVGRRRWQFFETINHVDLGDEGRIPPPLTHVGRKLTGKWLQKVLAGTGDVRPHMLARMPVFAESQLALLPEWLADADEEPLPDVQQVFAFRDEQAGRQFLGTGCIQCHRLNGERLPGVEGIDLANLARRIRPQWFYEFLVDPGAVKPRTRMPTFFPNGRSTNPTLLGGDRDRQIAALWSYLEHTDGVRLPDRMEREKEADFELIPRQQPILLRTFMESAGTHAVAVGFPEGVHFAFDAQSVRLAVAWKGAFLDAHGTWFDRFAPPAKPLGQQLRALDRDVLFRRRTANAPTPPEDSSSNGPAARAHVRWRGYRLDDSGTPTFLYELPGVQIEDRIAPLDDRQGLTRQLRLHVSHPTATAESLECVLLERPKIVAETQRRVRTPDGLSLQLKRGHAAGCEIRTQNGEMMEAVVPVRFRNNSWSLVLEYLW